MHKPVIKYKLATPAKMKGNSVEFDNFDSYGSLQLQFMTSFKKIPYDVCCSVSEVAA